MTAKVVAVTTAVLVGLVLAGTLSATAPVLAAIFGLTLTTAFFGGEATSVLRAVTGLIDTVSKSVSKIADEVVDN